MNERSRVRGNYDVYLGQTPGQTLGPFFQQGLLRTRAVFQVPGLCNDESDVFGADLASPGALGQRFILEGHVYDGLGAPIGDALLELWQANAQGRYDHPLDAGNGQELDAAFRGFGRAATDARGAFAFRSILPGAPAAGLEAPHLNLVLGARGMTRHAFTRVYFAGDARLPRDPVLALVPEARRHTLLARPAEQREGVPAYRFDIHLQGENETVFFDV